MKNLTKDSKDWLKMVGMFALVIVIVLVIFLSVKNKLLFSEPTPNCAVETADCYERLLVCEADFATLRGESDILKGILVDVPGDRLEEKVSRLLHELEVCSNQ